MPYGKGLHTVHGKAGHKIDLSSFGHYDDVAGMLRYIESAYEDEPLFVIRGRDALAVPVLAAYMGACGQCYLTGQRERASRHLDRFVLWQAENAKLTHLPDPVPSDPPALSA